MPISCALFWKEADKYQVKPLDASVTARLIAPRPSLSAGRNTFTWTQPITGVPNGDAPSPLNTSYSFKAEIEVPEGGAEGMLITQGGRFGGYGFYVLKSKPVFLWNLVDLKRVRWEGPELTPGKHVLEFDFKYDGLGPGTMAFGNYSGIGQGGTGVLKVEALKLPRRRWSIHCPSSCNGMRVWTSALTPALQLTIQTTPRPSPSVASSTASH
jgi:hypothetical protein